MHLLVGPQLKVAKHLECLTDTEISQLICNVYRWNINFKIIIKHMTTYLTLFRMGIFRAAHR